MHFVQPATAMVPARPVAPSQCSVPGHSLLPGCFLGVCAANSSLLIKSESRAGELPTDRGNSQLAITHSPDPPLLISFEDGQLEYHLCVKERQ